jgi:uncharacterized protein
MSNVPIVRELYDALTAHDEARIRAVLSSDIEWIQCAGFPGGGHRHGVEAVIEKVFSALATTWEGWRVNVHEFHDAGDTVLVMGTYGGTHSVTGRSMESLFAHVFDVGQGRITRFRQVADTAPIAAAIA